MDGVNEPGMNGPVEKVPDKKIFVVMGVFFGVLVILSFAFFVLTNIARNKSPISGGPSATGTQGGNPGTNTTATPAASYPPPAFQTKQWVVSSQAQPTEISTAETYGFKQNYTKSEIVTLAKSLNASQAVTYDADQSIAYTKNGPNDVSALKIDSKTGTFSYINTQGTPLEVNASTVENKIYSFLRAINWYDPTIKVTAHYKKSDQVGVVFYELHRDWATAGLPILNFNGLFNIDNSQPLSKLTLNTDTSMPIDNNIYATSDNKDGLKRADDFNTMTIAVSDDFSRIMSIHSNLRQLVPDRQSKVNVASYADAVQKLQNNQYQYIFTSPSGSGQVSWEKIYPQNKAITNIANITEATYAYLEQFPSQVQAQLKPFMIFRGTATLASGYDVNIIAAVDVTGNATTAMNNQVQGASTYLAQANDNTQQIGWIPVASAPVGATAPCDPQISTLNPTIDYVDGAGNHLKLGLGNYVRYNKEKGKDVRNEKRWYYIPPAGFNSKPLADRQNILRQAFNEFTTNIAALEATTFPISQSTLYCPSKTDPGHTDKSCKRTWELLLDDFMASQQYFGQTCPLIFSGLSPAIFVYGPVGQKVDIRSWSNISYANPATQDNLWHVTVGNSNLIVNNNQEQYIYYEYTGTTLSKPALGWNMNKISLDAFVNTISKKLTLNQQETAKLHQEITNAASGISGSDIFIGLINQQELNDKLPLSIIPAPQSVERIHFYIGKTNGSQVQAPVLKPVERKPFMIVEIGAYVGQ